MTHRYAIRLGGLIMRLLLRVIRVKAESAYVELDEDGVTIRFGYVHASIPYSNVASVETRQWPTRYGIGLRLAPKRCMGYIGTTGEVAWLTLREPQRLKAGPGKMSLERKAVAITLVEGAEFVRTLEERLASSAAE